MIFDTHAHYDDEAFDEDREALLSGLAAGGIGTVVNVGADMESTKTTIELTKRYPFIYGAAGVHPSSTAELDEEKFAELRVLAQSGKIVAIGEIGLDYYWEEPDHETQKKWFHRQLNLARELKLPVIIHSRDAAKDTLDIMNPLSCSVSFVPHFHTLTPRSQLTIPEFAQLPIYYPHDKNNLALHMCGKKINLL